MYVIMSCATDLRVQVEVIHIAEKINGSLLEKWRRGKTTFKLQEQRNESNQKVIATMFGMGFALPTCMYNTIK